MLKAVSQEAAFFNWEILELIFMIKSSLQGNCKVTER